MHFVTMRPSVESGSAIRQNLRCLDMAAGFEIQRERLEESFPRTQEIAFDSERKMMTTLHRGEKKMFLIPKAHRMKF